MKETLVQLSRVELINLVYSLNVCINQHEKMIEEEDDINLRYTKLQLRELYELREKLDNIAAQLSLGGQR